MCSPCAAATGGITLTREIDFKYRVLRNTAVFGVLHASPDGGAAVLRMDDSAEIKT